MTPDKLPSLIYFFVLSALVLFAWLRSTALIANGRSVWPALKMRQVPWGLPGILGVAGIYLLAYHAVVRAYLAVRHWMAYAEITEFSPLENLTLTTFVNLSALLIAIWALRRLSGAKLVDFGLDRDSRPMALAARDGAWMFLLVVLIVMAVMAGAIQIWKPNNHELEEMIRDKTDVLTLFVAFVSATLVAPLFEEFFFRGVIQQGLTRYWPPSRRAPWADFAMDVDHREENATKTFKLGEFKEETNSPTLEDSSSKMSLLAVWMPNVATSLLFAAVHSPQWPAPLPLFVLSLSMGYIFQRSGSLVASIVLHMLFNANSTILLLLSLLERTP